MGRRVAGGGRISEEIDLKPVRREKVLIIFNIVSMVLNRNLSFFLILFSLLLLLFLLLLAVLQVLFQKNLGEFLVAVFAICSSQRGLFIPTFLSFVLPILLYRLYCRSEVL